MIDPRARYRDPYDDERDEDEAGADAWDLDEEDAPIDPAEKARREALEVRRALGLDDAYGYHVEGGFFERDEVAAVAEDAPAQAQDAASAPPAYPCLRGHRYGGCVGAACPLERCWTGGFTVDLAERLRQYGQSSATLYVPGAPCLGCAHARSEEVTLPARPGKGGSPRRVETRVYCGRGLWRHAVSPASFVGRRIPLSEALEEDADGRVDCPDFAPLEGRHPLVAAHLRERRERTKARHVGGA